MQAVNEKLRRKLYEALHSCKRSPKEVAASMGISYNYLARAVMPGDSGCNFPIVWLIAFVKITGKFDALKVIVNACGFLMVRNPRVSKSTRELRLAVHRFQERFCGLIQSLIQFLNNPTSEKRDSLVDLLVVHQEEAELWKRIVKSGDVGQLEFAFERGV